MLKLVRKFFQLDPKYFRPTEVDVLIGDPTKAKEKLGWEPKYDINHLIKDMIRSDIDLMKKDQYLKQKRFLIKNLLLF